MNIQDPNAQRSRIHWHPELHFRLKEYLRYWRVTLFGRYDMEPFFSSFKEFCESWGVECYSIFEVYGQNDLIIRTWTKLPRKFYEEFHAWGQEPLKNVSVDWAEPSDFNRCLYHWLWSGSAASLPSLSDEIITRFINAPDEAESKAASEADRNELIEMSAIRMSSKPEPGIRFFMMITKGELDRIGKVAKEEYAQEVVNTILSIEGISAEEIYEGDQNIWLLIDARAEYENYSAVNELKTALHNMRITAMGCRTTTYLCCDNTSSALEMERVFVSKNETILPISDEEVVAALNNPEGSSVEIKGSLRLDMREFIKTGAVKKLPEIEEAILKTITGFLNNSGGLLIVGALEEARLIGQDLGNMPEFGEYRLCGVDHDLLNDGFDKAQRYLVDKVAQKIGAYAAQVIEIRRLVLEDKELMIVDVRKASTPQFYNDTIYLRLGASTKKLSGKETADYLSEFGGR